MSINLSSVDLTVIDKLALKRSKQLNFLLTVLQSISDSSADPDIVYPLFHEHLDLLDVEIIKLLRNWATAVFTIVDRDEQKVIAADIGYLGNLIQKFPLGNKAINMEWSIECYLTVLEVFTKDDLPTVWATIQNNLATAYKDRIKGDRAENIEHSIYCYQAALEIRTRANLPIGWAMTQNNLANAYSDRIRGDRDKNLELSIYCYQSALEVYTKEDLPINWAMTQNNLATTYGERVRGNRAENLELSIDCYLAALEIRTPELFPCEWVNTQIDLAKFSIEHLRNYQIATEHLQSAYEHLLTNNNDTGLLAQTMFELARCFHQTGCLEQAKIYFKDSIRLYQRLEQSTQVAAATSALGNLELQMGLIDDARLHLQTALEFYQAAGSLERVESIQELQQYLPVTSGAAGS